MPVYILPFPCLSNRCLSTGDSEEHFVEMKETVKKECKALLNAVSIVYNSQFASLTVHLDMLG